MTKTLVPICKIGTPFQTPSWRFQAIHYPEKFGFEWFCSRRAVDAGHLTRLIKKGLRPASVYTIPTYFKELLETVPPHLAEILLKVWNKHYFNEHRHKINFSANVAGSVPISWNMSRVRLLNDEFLKRMLYHLFNYRHDQHIEEALAFVRDKHNSMPKKWMNYAIYGKLTDAELAVMWQKSVGFVKAVRLMFFDYSHWPDDKLVHYSLIRQLVIDGELDEPDFHVFRRIYDLGMLGIKSITDIVGFTNKEKDEIGSFLEVSKIDKLLQLNYTCTDAKDAINFNRAAADYSNIGLKRLEIEQKAELLRLTAQKMAREMGVAEESSIYPEDSALIEELKERSRFDHIPKYPSFIDLKTGEVKLVANNP